MEAVGVLICPDASLVVTVVRCDLCAKPFAAAGGVIQRSALLMLSWHLRKQHGINALTDQMEVDGQGVERQVRLCK